MKTLACGGSLILCGASCIGGDSSGLSSAVELSLGPPLLNEWNVHADGQIVRSPPAKAEQDSSAASRRKRAAPTARRPRERRSSARGAEPFP
jgi:hypothetical protein